MNFVCRGWEANTYPLKEGNDNMVFRISFETLGMVSPRPGIVIRIAFKVSDATEKHTYWPNNASIKDPKTWGSLIFN